MDTTSEIETNGSSELKDEVINEEVEHVDPPDEFIESYSSDSESKNDPAGKII